MKRLLPEAAYDFWVEDCRDGMESHKMGTLAEAKAEKNILLKSWRARFPCQLDIRWQVNEHKVLYLLAIIEPKKRRARR